MMLSIGSVLIGALLATAPANNLIDAARTGDRAAVQVLLAQKANVNEAHGDGSTPLHWAAYRDDVEMARMLLQAGAKTDAVTRIGKLTPLLMAARNGHAPMLDLLLKSGADANSTNEAGTTALMLASLSGKADAVRTLLDRGAKVDARDTINGQTAVMFAAGVNAGPVIKVLKERGADLNVVSKILEPRDNMDDRDGINPNRRKQQGPWLGGLTALHLAAREGNTEAVRELIAAGADVNVQAATDKMTAITTASINGHFDIAKMILDAGADPNLASTGGITPLFMAIDQGWAARTWYPPASSEQQKITHLELMKGLLDKGANPNARMGPKLWFRTFHGDWVDPDGATAFWRAAQSNDIPAMKLLVSYKADPKIPTANGSSPLQVAAGFGYQPQTSNFAPDARLATVKYLVEELGLDVNEADKRGYTPLHGAALMNSLPLIDYLVSKGANPKVRANMVFGRNDDTNKDVKPGEGDSVADMANGPREWNLQYPPIVDHLIKLGSPFADDCKASTCVQRTRPEKTDTRKN